MAKTESTLKISSDQSPGLKVSPLVMRFLPTIGRLSVRSVSSNGPELFFMSLIFSALALGCGGADARRHSVSGNVSYDGTPVERGQISFVPVAGNQGPLAGGQIQNGHYEVPKEDGPFAGPHRIELMAIHKTGRKVPNMAGELIDHEENFLPDKYSDDTSELKVVIEDSGKNEHNFILEK